MSRRTHESHPEPDHAEASGSPRCPICEARVEPGVDAFPFCSRRCRMIDLGRWLGGRYVVSRPISDDDLTNHG